MEELKELAKATTPSAKQKVRQAVKRQAKAFQEIHRLKRRRLGAGPAKKLDSEDEEFLAKSIEEKATYHGRRHDTVMYTNRRVKSGDLLNIANFRLLQKGKKLIKSATTAWNRSKPRNKRSHQAKKHIGKSLFCTKKPPKTEDKHNVNTHHQRAHVRNVQRFLFSDKTKSNRKYCFAQSCDDKAYLRPGTSEGFEKTRNVKILTLAREGARQLPKYDWLEKMMYQTPATHRILNKQGIDVNGQEKLVSIADEHFVFIRPKHIVNSSGTTWANETHRLRCEFPDSFEVIKDEYIASKELRSFISALYGDVYLFRDMSEKDDIEKLTNSPSCRYKKYEERRLSHLLDRIDKAEAKFEAEVNRNKGTENIEIINQAIAAVRNGATVLLSKYKESFVVSWKDYASLLQKGDGFLDMVKSMHLPPVRPRWADFTDAGPGVAVSNFEVSFRDAELARLYSSDYRIRVHRAAGDSGQNEAERTNSAIGDAVVDGSTINWEYHKRFDGLTDEEISCLDLQEYEKMEEERTRKNAWKVANEVCRRIHDAPVHSEYIKSFVSEKPNDGLFFNQDLLKEYSSKTSEQRKSVPGATYIKKIIDFRDSHYQHGELYMEYLKGDCSKSSSDGRQCAQCQSSEWISPKMSRIPRPVPDTSRLPEFRYKDMFETYNHESEHSRLPDDWQPRNNIKNMFENGKLMADDEDAISSFANKFIVEKQLVKDHLVHLNTLERTRNLRSKDRLQKRQEMRNKRFDWDSLCLTGKVQKFNVRELDKYLSYFHLSFKGKKQDKVRRVIAHVCKKNGGSLDKYTVVQDPNVTSDGGESSDSEKESNSEDDLVITSYSSSQSSDSECEENSEGNAIPVLPLVQRSRSGRIVGTSFSRYRDCYLY